MNKLASLRLPALVLALLLAFGAGRLNTPSRQPQNTPATQPPATTRATAEADPANLPDILDAQYIVGSGGDAWRYRVMWEHTMRELYQRMYESTGGDHDMFLTVYGGLYRYLDWAGAMAAQSHGEATLAELYRHEAGRLWNELGGDLPAMDAWADSGAFAQQEAEMQQHDRLRRFEIDPFPLAGEWPEYGLRLWSLGNAYASVLEIDGRRVLFPLHVASLWRSPPEATQTDLDGDGQDEIILIICQGWGTGVLNYGLGIVQYTPEKWPYLSTPAVFENEDFAALVAPYVTITLEGSDVVARGYGSTVVYSLADWEAPVTEVQAVLDQIAWVEMTEAGGFRLRMVVGFASEHNASPIFVATIEGDLHWDGMALKLENAVLTSE